MRAFGVAVLLVIGVMAGTGCVAVVGNETARPCREQRVIERDGELYVVDLKDKTYYRLELEPQPAPVVSIEAATTVEVLEEDD